MFRAEVQCREPARRAASSFIVKKNAKLSYSTIENWSKNMYNLNTKACASCEEGGTIEWVIRFVRLACRLSLPDEHVEGQTTRRMEFTGVTFAGKGQNLDTGAKVLYMPRKIQARAT